LNELLGGENLVIAMKLKNGYKHDKPKYSTGKWLKRYFEKRTVRRKKIDTSDIICPVCGYYCTGKGGYGCIDKPSMQ